MDQLTPLSFLKFLSPPQEQFLSEEYDGLEFRWKSLVFRPAMFKVEAALFWLLAIYFISAMVGAAMNSRKVTAWTKAHTNLLRAQFFYSGTNVISDGPCDYVVYSTGRKAIANLHAVFSLIPRQDIAQLIFVYGRSLIDLDYSPSDSVTLDFTLKSSSDAPIQGFVWGVVAKTEMNELRRQRWDLTFTKTSDNSALPMTCSLMSESSDISTLILKSPAGTQIATLLNDPKISRHFRSLIITDSPDKRPAKGAIPADKRERRVILSLHLASGSQAGDTEPLIQAVVDLIDWMDSKPAIRPDIASKLSKFRKELDVELDKEANALTPEEKEEADEVKRTAKRKAEEEKFNAMTPEQQRKHEEQERKRAQRKAQGKLARRH